MARVGLLSLIRRVLAFAWIAFVAMAAPGHAITVQRDSGGYIVVDGTDGSDVFSIAYDARAPEFPEGDPSAPPIGTINRLVFQSADPITVSGDCQRSADGLTAACERLPDHSRVVMSTYGADDDITIGPPSTDPIPFCVAFATDAGDDRVRAHTSARLRIALGRGDDSAKVRATAQRAWLHAGPGNDVLRSQGSAGTVIYGAAGSDLLFAGPGPDRILAGDGDDQVDRPADSPARWLRGDHVRCGAGFDTVGVPDVGLRARGCELFAQPLER
jgi:Ca2+-binding RTX toxin-like protein